MKPASGAAILLLVVLSACKPADELAWVRKADPAKMVAEDMQAGRLNFLEVCGRGCSTPGLGALTYARCYSAAASTRPVDPTGDAATSETRAALKTEVARFAETYNKLLKAALDKSGKRACGAGERWEELSAALTEVARQIPPRPYPAAITAALDPRAAENDFHLHVPDYADLTQPLRDRLCALVSQHGIKSALVFKVTTGAIRQPVLWPNFTCLGGRMQRLRIPA